MKIGELFYSLGAEFEEKALSNIEKGFDRISKSFLTAVGVASTALAGTFTAVKEFASANDELGKLARNKDIAVGTLQAVKYSFESAGIEGDKLKDVFEKLKEGKEGFRQGKGDAEAFAMLGINPNKFKTTEDFFYGVLDNLKKIKNEDLKTDLSKRILGFADMKNLIDGGSEAIKKQKKELEDLGIALSDEDTDTSAKFNDTLLNTTTILKGLANKIFTKLMPIFIELMQKFNDFIKLNRVLLSSGLNTFLDVVINGSKFFLSLIGRIIEHLGGMKTIIITISVLLVYWQWPLLAIVAIIVAVLVAFDDLMNFFEGNDSVIGGWVDNLNQSFQSFKEKFPNIGAIVQLQLDNIKAVFTVFKDTLFNIWDLITGKISFSDFLSKEGDIVLTFLNQIKDTFLNFVDYLAGLFPNISGIFKAEIEIITSIFEYFKDTLFNIWDLITGKISFSNFLSKQLEVVNTLLSQIKNSFLNFVNYLVDLFSNLDLFGGIGKQIDGFTDKIGSYFGFSGNENNTQASSNQMIPNQIPSTTTTTNTYNISANVDAKTKNISDAIFEISSPAGY